MSAINSTQPAANSTQSTQLQVDDTSSTIAYAGTWVTGGTPNYFDDTYHQTNTGGSSADIAFSGTNISVLADSFTDHGRFYCQLVGENVPWFWGNGSIGNALTGVMYNLTFCTLTGIANTSHILRIGLAEGDTGYVDVSSRPSSQRASILPPLIVRVVQVDSYILNLSTPAGTKGVWDSHFPVVVPPAALANTTSIISAATASSTARLSSITSSSATPNGATPATSSAASPPAQTGSHSRSAAIGVGVGVGIAGAAALAFLWFYLSKRRQRSYAGTSISEKPQSEVRPAIFARSTPDYTRNTVGSSDAGRGELPYSGHPEPSNFDQFSTIVPASSVAYQSINQNSTELLEDPDSFAPRH